MANFTAANLVVAQTIVTDTYAKPEMRIKPAPAFELLSSNQSIITEAVTLRTRDDRPIEGHILTRNRRAAGAQRTHNHTGAKGDSAKIDLSWTAKTDKFSISLKLLDRSVFEFNTVFANQMAQCAMNILEAKESEAIAYLQAQRTQISAALKGSSFNAATDTIDINAADKKRFFLILESALRQNNYTGQLDVITDNLMAIDAAWLAAQGANNAENTAFQFLRKMRMVESNDLADANYENGLVIAMPAQTACALNWIPKQNRMGWGDYASVLGGFGTFQFAGHTFAVHGYMERADTSASNGDTQDVNMEFELSLDSSFNRAPLSTATETTIFQAGVAA